MQKINCGFGQAKPTKVLIADKSSLVREGIRALIKQTGPVNIIGEAGSAEDLIKIAKDTNISLLIADCKILIEDKPNVPKFIQKFYPKLPIIGLIDEDEGNESPFNLLKIGVNN